MAPVEKRAADDLENDPKRQKVEEEDPSEGQEGSEGSEDLELTEEQLMELADMPDDMDLEDFADVEGFTEEDLEAYTELYEEFIAELDKETDEGGTYAVILEKPTSHRPIPKTLEELKAVVVKFELPVELVKEVRDRMTACVGETTPNPEDMELPVADAEEITDEQLQEIQKKMDENMETAKQKQQEMVLEEMKLANKREDPKEKFMHFLCITQFLFELDAQTDSFEHACFNSPSGVQDMLNLLSTHTKEILAMEDKSGLTAKQRESFVNYVKTCQVSLHDIDLDMDEKEGWEQITFTV